MEAIKIFPDYANAYKNLGVSLVALGEKEAAIEYLRKAFQIAPLAPSKAHNNFGVLLAGQGRLDEAISHFRKALEQDPEFEAAANNLITALKEKNEQLKDDESIRQ